MRQLVLDTETTGLKVTDGHRVIEIGIVELRDRQLTGNDFHHYLRPERAVDPDAQKIHGLSAQFLSDKPRFVDIAPQLLEYLHDAELIIHNAEFDLGFVNAELQRWQPGIAQLETQHCVIDTLKMARERHPSQSNSLDALCKRYTIDATQRTQHGALLDSILLAQVYLAMTRSQVKLFADATAVTTATTAIPQLLQRASERAPLRVVLPTAEELVAHESALQHIDRASGHKTLWRQVMPSD